MANRRTVDLLPEIFRTNTNRKFLAATLDQLTQEPQINRTRGYVGRRVGPGVNPADNYLREINNVRANYQLEPGVTFFKPDTTRVEDAITYPGMIDSLALSGADVTRQDKLFSSEYYSWDPFCDLDKFTNYSQYYWLPQGPDSVDVSSTDIPLTDDFSVVRNSNNYTFSGLAGNNPVITLVRGGNYTFEVNQPGASFWIQSAPGVNGRLPSTPNISSRDVLGVQNNGTQQGTVTFNVPLKTAQDFFYSLNDVGPVDLATELQFIDINNRYVDDFLAQYPNGIDGITNLEDQTLVFLNRVQNAQDGGWQVTTQFDPTNQLAFARSGTAVNTDYKKFTNLACTTVTGAGSGAVVTVIIDSGSTNYSLLTTQVIVENVGNGYAVGDRLKIAGNLLGGTSPANDLELTVTSLTDNGLTGSFDTTAFDQTTDITNIDQRYSIWRVQYIDSADGRPFMRLVSVTPVPVLSKLQIRAGAQFSSTQWYRSAEGYYDRIPLLTAVQDTLWYQDSNNPEIFGQIRLVDAGAASPIDIEDIIGAKNYTSPNGVVFTNGLKVQFRGLARPAQFQDLEYYVEGVGTGPGIENRIGFVDGEAYFGQWHVFHGKRYTGLAQNNGSNQIIYDTYEESLANLNGTTVGDLGLDTQVNAVEGNGIKLIPVRELVTPETYTRSLTVPYDSTPFDSTNYDESLNSPVTPDYITINRASRDLNAWSRSNRWFHVDVIKYSAELNNITPVIDNQFRGKRPIIEFRANLGLYNFGTQGKLPVNIIDFSATDALSTINGATGYSIDGYTFIDGTRVIFAADVDREVRNRIYTVQFIDPDGDANSPRIINLVPDPDGAAREFQTVVSLSGATQQGISFWFDGADWQRAQQKTSVNQPPLFDVYDAQGRSFGNRTFYPSTTFAGSKLFGYALGQSGIIDSELGIPIKYLNINNVGDIVFENFLYTDKFIYVADNVGVETDVSSGFVRQYINRLIYSKLIGWQTAITESQSRQTFRFTNSNGLLILDVPVTTDSIVPGAQVFVDGQFIDPQRYNLSVEGQNTFITLLFPISESSVIEVQVLSNEASSVGFYAVPLNLENNPLNQNSNEFSLGTIRTHYESIGQNLKDISGPIVGANNTRDLGNILRYGNNIVQNSAPITLAGVFLREKQYEITQAIKFNSQEYDKYKARLLDLVSKGDFVNLTPTQILDSVLLELSLARDENSPFYWSDMIPANETYSEINVVYSVISTPTFDTRQVYDFSHSNYRALLVFVNGRLLTLGRDYTVGDGTPTVTITTPLSVGDRIAIREYDTTFGSFVPNTPTKMGLYPAFEPQIFIDNSYQNPRLVIRGHDGSITVAYSDDRDQVLLEFETRIYNNLKIRSEIPVVADDVIPGQWRVTDYSLAEVNQILSEDFLSWVGWNKLDYTTQSYIATNPWTYNYNQSSDKLDGNPLLGAWRGIYQYFYDTVAPNTRPWEMLGFSEQPDWWENFYGPAPYTSGNWVLWEDLAAGIVRDPAGEYVIPKYARPGLITQVVDSVEIISGGTGYLTAPTITISNPPASPYNRPAVLGNAVIQNGVIVSIPVIDSGRGYTEPPTITIVSNTGRDAVAVARIATTPLTIPSGPEGELLAPLDSVVGNYDTTSFRRSWTFGDGGPTEYAWRSSSAWPFAVMRLLALTKPAKFFSLFADRDRYKFDDSVGQYLWDERYRLNATNLAPLYGSGVSRASYINWIIDYNRQLGLNSTNALTRRLNNIDVRLCWRTAAFTDKKLLKIFTERSTPTSTNASLLLPDESYSLLLYQNPAFERFSYSSVIVQRTDTGWSVLGYDPIAPYFNILTSQPNGITATLFAGELSVNVSTQYTNNVTRVPYGYVFTNRASVCDFLISYGKFLERQGLTFEGLENGYVMDWQQMAQEFLYWSSQGWVNGSMINLNPAATKISITRPGAVAESLQPPRLDNILLNQNRQPIPSANLVIDRIDNTLTMSVDANSNDTINYFNIRFTAYEHLVVLDNRSIFADLIYDPVTNARQSRVLVSAALTADWNGTVNAPGFILNQNNIPEWQPNRTYTKGEIVLFKDEYWTASTIIQANENFNYTLWVRSDYDQVQRGLLPNAAAASDELANSYSVFTANLETEVDLFSYGLIGFRPREYMQALDLSDVSQVNLYQQFLKNKGTRPSVEIFSLANLGKEVAEYDINEYWAIRNAFYGANANRSYFEVLLDAPKLTSNPSVIEVIQPGQTSQADQTVFVNDLWKTSFRITQPNILPVVPDGIADRALPNAGYVNFDDVDLSIFSLNDLTDADVANIGIGTTIWVPADGAYEWNVYRTEKIPGNILQVSDNLDGRSLVTFSRPHGLSPDDWLLIRFFAPAINGAYQVLDVPSIDTVVIQYSFSGFQTAVTGNGLALGLQSSRIAQPSDAALLPYSNLLTTGALIWVDKNTNGQWTVLEKTQPFTATEGLQLQFAEENSRFGQSISQGFFNLSALVGAPGYNPNNLAEAPGAVYSYVKSDLNQYEFNSILSLTTTGISGYGNAVDIGNQQWAVIGASDSNNQQGYAVVVFRPQDTFTFEQRQLLTAPDLDFEATEFGYSVAITNDERWLVVGAPGESSSQVGGSVYVFGRVDVQPQSVAYETDGFTSTYNYSNHIEITDFSAWQFVVVLENVLLTPIVDYAVGANDITLNAPPPAGQSLIITRRTGIQLDQQRYNNVQQTSTSGVGTGARFVVNRVRGQYTAILTNGGQNYAVGNTLTISAASIGGGSSPANDLTITVDSVGTGGNIETFTQSGSGVNNTAVFDLSEYFAQIDNIWAFNVVVNDQLLRPNQDYEYNSGNLEFTSLLPPPGATILVSAQSQFTFVQKIAAPSLAADSRFGESVTTSTTGDKIIVSAPGYDDNTGRVFVYDRATQQFQYNGTNNPFVVSQTLVAPTNVTVNGEFLLDTELNINGEFTVTGSNSVSIDTNRVALNVGDIVGISTNQFRLMQEIDSYQPFEDSKFGFKLDQCVNDCSLYISAPYDGSIKPAAGHVEFLQNQSRVYGSITSQIANPVLTVGNTLFINNFLVTCSGTTVESLAADINNARVPNATARVTDNLTLTADGTSSIYDIGSIYSSTVYTGSPITKVLLNGVAITAGVDYEYNNNTEQIRFIAAPPVQGTIITVVSGRLIVSAVNPDAAPALDKVRLSPGTGTLWQDLLFDTYVWQQTITSPVPQDFAHFGESIFISEDAISLVVGAPRASLIRPTTFDLGNTNFDAGSTNWVDPVTQSGAVYTFDFLPAVNATVQNPGQFVFGQQIISDQVESLDEFGRAINLTTGTLLIGAPGHDLGDSQANFGLVAQFENINNQLSWQVRRQQQPSVDVNLLNTIFVYDYLSSGAPVYLDFFDPLQGRLLGAVQQNINYYGAVDPANYNIGPVNNRGSRWAQEHVGEIWWDTRQVRFVDPNQGDITYASRQWGQIFPGSQVNLFQWIASSTPPAQYTGPGTPRSLDSYVVVPSIDEQGIFADIYYFWVTGVDEVDTVRGKTLSIETITRYIENPRASGIPYVAPLSSSTVALYNCEEFIAQGNAVLHVEFDQVLNDAAVHVQYQLIPQDKADGFLNPRMYRKLLDSFCGADTNGALVPDPLLSPVEKYGIQYRPRQSMFVNRFAALQNYLQSANAVLAKFPITEIRSLQLLNSAEPEPSSNSGQWDKRVANDQELSYQNLAAVPVGYRYLVESDARNRGLWTIYEVVPNQLPGQVDLLLTRVQNFDTRLYWNTIDWYQEGYDPATRIVTEVPVFSSLLTLNVPVGSSVKVTGNGSAKWEIYRLENSGWVRVALQDGTIEFDERLWNYQAGRYGFDVEVFDSQYFDQAPIIETRKVLEAINQQLLIDELLIERNRLLILMFNYILSEQLSPDWLTKTSLIDVTHTIRELRPFQIYRQDNQDFVLDYINEVKPYHVQIREFGLVYRGQDAYLGTLTDFDVPAFWDAAQNQFISPVLDNTGTLSTTSSTPSNSAVWQNFPWNQWFQNYTLSIESVTVINGGQGYTVPPQVEISGSAVIPAVMTARVNSAGQVVAIDIVNPGQGYTETAIITLVGGNGSGAQAVAVMGNQLVRSLSTTIKYDRYQYKSDIQPWQSNVIYSNNELVRFDNRVWAANGDVTSQTFDPNQWTLVPAGSLSGVDRTMGYYTPLDTEPGLDLALLISGVDYPGVQVSAPLFNQNTGFDVGNFDINPFDNISFGPEGLPTYDPAILDAIYESNFTDPFLGVLPAPAYAGDPPNAGPNPIVVDGGAFVDTYSSHAPEELVPGAIFDTLDMRVYTRPGSDWEGDGHGWPAESVNFVFTSEIPPFLLFEVIRNSLILINTRTQQELIYLVDYTIDFTERTITFSPLSVQIGDLIDTTVYAIGTRNIIFAGVFPYPGPATPLPAPPQLIDQVARLVQVAGVTTESFADLVENPVTVNVWNRTTQSLLISGVDYAVNWVTKEVTVFTTNTTIGNVIQITAYGVGGGSQLFNNSYLGAAVGNTINLPVQFSEVDEIVIWVNGTIVNNYSYAQNGSQTRVVFNAPLTATQRATVAVLGEPANQFVGSWSAPVTQLVVSDGGLNIVLENSLSGTNPATLIVTRNGRRVRPSDTIDHIGDGSSAQYLLPQRGGYLPQEVSPGDVSVYVDNRALVLNIDFVLDPAVGMQPRTITFFDVPAPGAKILIAVRTAAQYFVNGNLLSFQPSQGLAPQPGDLITITTWNDTSEQDIVTRVWVGPESEGVLISEGYDTVPYDVGLTTDAPGSFDYGAGTVIQFNRFNLEREIVDTNRILVTLDGRFLFPVVDYDIQGTELIIFGPTISNVSVVTVTMFTQAVVPAAIGFRIFQDMRGTQLMYRINSANNTVLTANLGATDDVIHVADASKLDVPNLAQGLFGLITINGERISYRTRDVGNNTVSGLRRGTAGTAAASHAAGSDVLGIGVDNLLPLQYQNRLVFDNILANGTQTVFVAESIVLDDLDSSELIEAVQVFVGGQLQTSGFTIDSANPVTVIFDTPPTSGYQVTIQVKQARSLYQPGIVTASNGKPLQETDTEAARFIREK